MFGRYFSNHKGTSWAFHPVAIVGNRTRLLRSGIGVPLRELLSESEHVVASEGHASAFRLDITRNKAGVGQRLLGHRHAIWHSRHMTLRPFRIAFFCSFPGAEVVDLARTRELPPQKTSERRRSERRSMARRHCVLDTMSPRILPVNSLRADKSQSGNHNLPKICRHDSALGVDRRKRAARPRSEVEEPALARRSRLARKGDSGRSDRARSLSVACDLVATKGAPKAVFYPDHRKSSRWRSIACRSGRAAGVLLAAGSLGGSRRGCCRGGRGGRGLLCFNEYEEIASVVAGPHTRNWQTGHEGLGLRRHWKRIIPCR